MTTATEIQHGILINGRAVEVSQTFDVEDPATGTVIARVTDGDAAEAVAAVDAATAAFGTWSATPLRERAEILRRAYELTIAATEELAGIICAENGKSQSNARAEVTYAAEFFRWFGEEAARTDGTFGISPAGNAHTIVAHRPVGVAALVTPWNFPAAMATRKLAPALAAGCTAVLKPAAETPLTAIALVRILSEAGVPDGVVNLVTTTRAQSVVSAWLADRRVRKLSFTGSTGVGRQLLAQCSERVVNSSMELGGNAPFVVMPDADVDAAVEGAMIAKFRGSGQACTAANRFYVHRDIAEEFVTRFGKAVEQLKVGPAQDSTNQVGPLITARAAANVRRLVEQALAQGARIAAQAESCDTGHFVAPTLLTDVPADAAILGEEIFGPVAPVVLWDDEAELLRWINETEYGLAAYVYAGRLDTALRIATATATEAGMVGVNRGVVSDPSAPFGGMKQSGLGREGAREGLHEFQETQYLSVDLNY